MPAISLITPTRNRANLLLRTIANVQQQTLTDWEMIVVDDGDGSGMLAASRLRDARIRSYANAGVGQVDARNQAIEEARGTIIHLLDDDDRWMDAQHLEQVVAHFQQYKGLLYRGGWLILEQEQDSLWLEQQRIEFNPIVTAESLRVDNTLLTSGVSYPKELHQALGLFDTQLGNYWDWDWFLRVSKKYPMQQLSPATVLMSWRGSNTSRNPLKPQRVMYLERFAAKHELGSLESKNHFTVIQPNPQLEPKKVFVQQT